MLNLFFDKNVQDDLDQISQNLKGHNKKFHKKVILITGGAGFLGYYLTYYFAFLRLKMEIDVSVIVTDNFIRGRPSWLKVVEDEWSSFLKIVEHNIIDPIDDEVIKLKPDYIIHAASIASPIFYRKRPIETMDANILGLRSLLDYSLSRNNSSDPIDGFLFFSSSEIYGSPANEFIPTPENYNGNVSCTGPRACYDESKRFGETLCVNFANQENLPIKIARPFNNYGPGLKLDDGRVVSDFANNILNGEDIILFSDGKASRTFCYIVDAISGYLLILLNGVKGESYNIGIEEPEITIGNFAKIFADVGKNSFGLSSNVIFKISNDTEYNTDNPVRRCPKIDKARSLGYNPSVSLEDGLRRTLTWYKRYLETLG
jgi:dTDP-glucose 4,6-dehydratase/UDP-glucuronate decarboxylase